jgi:hypothetical protein
VCFTALSRKEEDEIHVVWKFGLIKFGVGFETLPFDQFLVSGL